MDERMMENNRVTVVGEVVSPFRFSHEVFGEGFYIFDLAVTRLSGTVDTLPVMVSDRLVDVTQDYRGCQVEVTGQFRSYNRHEGEKRRLKLNIFALELYLVEGAIDPRESNEIYLDGYICKEPIYRKTPQGREITDLLLAVNRPYGKSDYIPCIAWGRNAEYAAGLSIGDRISVTGRVQSREYTKKLSDTECEKRVAYEVSVSELEVLE